MAVGEADWPTFHMCNENLTQWEEAFRGLDINGDGIVSPRDISNKMMRLGIPHSIDDLSFAVREIAGDGSEEIDFNTLIPLFTYQAEGEEDIVELKETFSIFDRNGDGYITTAELKQVLEDLGDSVSDEDVRAIIASTDSDQDGLINFEEFRAIWSSCCLHQ
uniref:EF-hand domain-containing protein n=1 Tax=Trichuris muris TaxID=70415 RepID=A0A5S6R5W0_TRIMR